MRGVVSVVEVASREYPVTFPAGREILYGVFSEPAQRVDGVGVILMTGGNFLPMTHRNGVLVRLARRIAGDGVPVLRFDYHGVGESTGKTPEYSLDLAFAFSEDLEGAVRWLRGKGVSRLIIVGSCFGTRTILASSERLPELEAAVLLGAPLRSYTRPLTTRSMVTKALHSRVLKNMFDARSRTRQLMIVKAKAQSLVAEARRSWDRTSPTETTWVSLGAVNALRRLSQRRVKLVFIYGRDTHYFRDFQEVVNKELTTIEEGQPLEVRTVDGVQPGYRTVEMQRVLIDMTHQAIRDLLSLQRPTP